VTGSVHIGSPSGELLRAAATAEVLVVGSAGHGTVPGVLLGSVSTSVAVHSPVPVVVVRSAPKLPSGRIVVGVDGSPPSLAAVEFAVKEASWRGASLTAVHVSTGPFPLVATTAEPQRIHRRDADPTEAAVVSETLAGWEEKFPDVLIDRIFMVGHAVPALVDAARGADLLAVGSRGRAAFSRLLLGSVSLGVLHLAPVPGGSDSAPTRILTSDWLSQLRLTATLSAPVSPGLPKTSYACMNSSRTKRWVTNRAESI
jgi:nucleotide-binding universal stress UspA family protein